MLLSHEYATRHLRACVQRRHRQLPRTLRLLRNAGGVHSDAGHHEDRTHLGKLRRQPGRQVHERRFGTCAARLGALVARSPSTSTRMMRALAAPLVLALALVSRPAAAGEPDPWFGPDKALHFGVSMGLAAGGYAAVSPWLDSRAQRALAGGAFSLTLGAGKELWDLAGHGDPSFRDFTWDVLGTAAGVALAVGVDALISNGKGAPVERAAQGLVFHF